MIKAIIGLTLTIVCLLLLIASINSTITVLELEPTTHGITVSKFYAVILLAIINALLFGGLLVNIYGIYIAYRNSRAKKDINKLFTSIIADLKKEDTARPSNYDFRRNPEGYSSSDKHSVFDALIKWDRVEKGREVNAVSKRPLRPDEVFRSTSKDVDSAKGVSDDSMKGNKIIKDWLDTNNGVEDLNEEGKREGKEL